MRVPKNRKGARLEKYGAIIEGSWFGYIAWESRMLLTGCSTIALSIVDSAKVWQLVVGGRNIKVTVRVSVLTDDEYACPRDDLDRFGIYVGYHNSATSSIRPAPQIKPPGHPAESLSHLWGNPTLSAVAPTVLLESAPR